MQSIIFIIRNFCNLGDLELIDKKTFEVLKLDGRVRI